MLKVIAQTFLGLLILFTGLYIMYFYVTGIDEGSSILLLLLSLPVIGGGIFVLLRAGKSDASVVKKMDKNIPSILDKEFAVEDSGLENTIKKNNELTQEWSKTNEARNRLRMLELSSEAQEKS